MRAMYAELRRLHRVQIVSVALVIILSVVLLWFPGRAEAHGSCAVHRPRPSLTGIAVNVVRGWGELKCTKGHRLLHLVMRLQRRYSPQTKWISLTRSEVNVTQAHKADVRVKSGSCGRDLHHTWQYHDRVSEAWALNRSGVLAHILAPPVKDSPILYTPFWCGSP